MAWGYDEENGSWQGLNTNQGWRNVGNGIAGLWGNSFGKLLSPEKLKLEKIPGYNVSPYEEMLKQRALSQGPSEQAKYLMSMSETEGQNQLASNMANNEGMAQAGISNLAMRGGVGSGARERLMQGANKNTMIGNQGIYGNMLQSKNAILAQDEANKQGIMQGLQGLYDNRRSDDMKAWAAQQSAQAQYKTANSPGINNLWGIGNLPQKLF